VGRKGRRRLLKLRDELVRVRPSVSDPDAAIASGAVIIDGRIVSNPASLVREGAAITLRIDEPLRGEAKLQAALASFEIGVGKSVALDVGPAAGGFYPCSP
jgi:predicted rRNA methylase YqxC with S4 and FtsJ domains